jgi:nucleotide-binding universal stress UspA family protein
MAQGDRAAQRGALTRIKRPRRSFAKTGAVTGGSAMTAIYQKLLVPVDGSPTATRGLDEAIRVARLSGGRIRVIHVIDQLQLAAGLEFSTADVLGLLQEAGAAIVGAARARVETSGVPVETQLSETLSGTVADAVVDQARAWGADLIVIGTHGRRGVRRLMIGSDAERIVRLASVPVLLVRDEPVETARLEALPTQTALPVGSLAVE